MPSANVLQPPVPTQAGNQQYWSSLPGPAQALAIASSAADYPGLTLVVTADSAAAYRLAEALEFFSSIPASEKTASENSRSQQQTRLPILTLPDWETLPYDVFSPHQDIISDRLRTLYRLPSVTQGILVVPITTLMHRLPPRNYLLTHSLVLAVGESCHLTALRQQLEKAGYHCVNTVYEHGEFAVRGSIIDIFPTGSSLPYRIDLFDEEIESLRTFDVESQRTLDKVATIELLPAKEFPLDEAGISTFRHAWHDTFNVDHRHCPLYQDVSRGIAPAGIEYYLPLFFDHCEDLFSYLPESVLLITEQNCYAAAENFWAELTDRYEQRSIDPQRPILPPGQGFLRVDELFSRFKALPRITLSGNETPGDQSSQTAFACSPGQDLFIDARAENPLHAVQDFLRNTSHRILFCVESIGRRESLLELLRRIHVQPTFINGWLEFITGDTNIAMTLAPLESGFALDDLGITVITESQLFGARVLQKRRRRKTTDTDLVIQNLAELRPGAPVVHIDHGVGRYLGLQRIAIDGQDAEFLTLQYADDAKLYVPVASLHLISRYSGADEELAPLHRLGSEQWQKARRKAAEKISDVAAQLLDIYARREARPGMAMTLAKDAYEAFAAGFPFEETPDQEATIEAVLNDLQKPSAMDRLVCGDVGFGKTEVAMRATFIAVNNGKQVVILVPTTLLAQQHFSTFSDRFADFAVNIELMSRFRSAKELQAVEEKLAAGSVDIVIGTHRLLQGKINYKNLGLLIIDEEHRFGVKQKEALKALRAEVDILTLTATPIPRTLNMAMTGIRDLSIIATPPSRRLAIKTFVCPHNNSLIKEAVLREIFRGGQVYYLHNEVKTIDAVAEELRKLIPEARIGIAHGQMRERELERAMSEFYHQHFNILLCSTIIENGIDVPSANTIIINRADKFGLAQLHQLRGRVGRSHHQAYAYLLTPDPKTITPDAVKRLDAIAEADALGSGFMLANHDLEIRGAGELLGEEQSGQIQSIGFSLYMSMLEQAVAAIKEGRTPNLDQPLQQGSEINLRIPALIPDHYLPDVHNRLILYKRIANARTEEELWELQVEMIDRFGLLPEATKNLFRITQLKLDAQQLGLTKIEAGPRGGRMEFGSRVNIEPITLVKLVQGKPETYKLDGATTLKFATELEDTEQRIQFVSQLIKHLTPTQGGFHVAQRK